MKASDPFVKVIGEYIEKERQADPLFSKCVDDQPNKTVQGCVNFILNEVKKSGVAGWTDDEIFGMAKHFYDEKELKDPGSIRAKVVVNHHVDLSEEEKAQAKEKAKADYEKEQLAKLKVEERKREEKERKAKEERIRKQKEAEERQKSLQLSLFDMM